VGFEEGKSFVGRTTEEKGKKKPSIMNGADACVASINYVCHDMTSSDLADRNGRQFSRSIHLHAQICLKTQRQRYS